MMDAARTRARPARILLVEDDPDDVELTRRALERANLGNQLTVAADGKAALDVLYGTCRRPGERSVDLVLLDLNLPRVDGRKVLSTMQEDEQLRGIPVIMLTVSDRVTDVCESYRGGAAGFLRKPLEVDRLLTTVGDLHDYQVVIARR